MKNCFYRLLLFLFLCTNSCHILPHEYTLSIPISEFKLIKIFKTKHSFIGVVRRKNTMYIVKQKINQKTIHWSIIQSIIADRIANSIDNISSQRVFFIPKDIFFPGKMYQDEPAALITVVPGMSVQRWQMNIGKLDTSQIRELIRKFSIKQNPKLNLSIIRCMAKHNDLPYILALHTILGFYDGHKRNIFYDSISDKFSIIDMDCSYKVNLAVNAYTFIEKFFTTQQDLKPKIKQALLQFADALECIMEKNPIHDIKKVVSTIIPTIIGKNKKMLKQYALREKQIDEFLQESYAVANNIIHLIRQKCVL